MSSLVCRLCYVQCRTQIFHVDIFLFPVFMSQVYFRFKVICKVASSLKGHLSVISERASVMADLNQNIDMTKLEKTYKKHVDRSEVEHGKENVTAEKV